MIESKNLCFVLLTLSKIVKVEDENGETVYDFLIENNTQNLDCLNNFYNI